MNDDTYDRKMNEWETRLGLVLSGGDQFVYITPEQYQDLQVLRVETQRRDDLSGRTPGPLASGALGNFTGTPVVVDAEKAREQSDRLLGHLYQEMSRKVLLDVLLDGDGANVTGPTGLAAFWSDVT